MRLMKVHKVTLLIVDHDDIGTDEVATVLREVNYPNDCIGPQILKVETVEVEWDYENDPLNDRRTRDAEVKRLFPTVGAPNIDTGVTVPLTVAAELLAAIKVRRHWYTLRGHDVPEAIALAYSSMSDALGEKR